KRVKETRFERVLRNEETNRRHPVVQIVAELLRRVRHQAVVREDEKEALVDRRVPLVRRLERLERFGCEENAIGGVYTIGNSESIFSPVAVVHRDARPFGERLASDAKHSEREHDLRVEAARDRKSTRLN